MKKLLSAFLAVLMVFGCISTSLVHVFAEDSDWNATAHFTPDTQSSSSQWTQSGTSAQSLAGRTFFMEVRVTNNSGSAQTKEFVLTGNNLDNLSFSHFNQDDTNVLIFTDDEGVAYTGSLSRVKDSTGKTTSLKVTINAGANPEGTARVQQLRLPVSFKSHSFGGSVSINANDVTGSGVSSVSEMVTDPTLTTTNAIATSSTFYQWLEDKSSTGSITATATTKQTTNSSSSVAIPYLDSVTVKQTVTFNRFSLTSDPAVTFSETPGANDTRTITYTHDASGNCTGYVVTYTRTRAEGQTGELTMPVITSKAVIKKSDFTPGTSIVSNTQAIYVDSTVEGIPAGGTEDDKFGPKSGAQVTKAATRWASVSWTIAGVTDDQGNTTQDPPRNTTQTNLTPGTTNVTNYNITTKATGCGNSLFFIMQGEGPTPSSGNKVSSTYAQHFDNELTSFKVTDEKGNVVCADLATAYARGWVEKDSDGKYRMK